MKKAALPLAIATFMTVGISRADVPSVAVDIAPVHSLVAQVMGTLGEPALVISPGASPHSYSLRPSEAQSLQDADVVFWVSAELTPWLADTIVTLAPHATRVELLEADGTTELTMRENALFEAHDHEDEGVGNHDGDDHHDETHSDGEDFHEEGHKNAHDDDDHDHDEQVSGSDDGGEHEERGEHGEHGEHDPHAWLDPSNAAIWLDTIAVELTKADPVNSETYMANAASGKARLEQLTTDVKDILAPVRNRNFIVFHDAYHYFENAFDFPASGAISVSDASKPSPARIQQIRDRVAQASVTCVLTEPQFNPDLVNTVLDGTNAKTGSIDPLGSHLGIGPALYEKLMRELAQTLADCVS